MVKGLHKLFKTIVKQILQDFPPLGKSDSEVSHLIQEPRNFTEVITLSDDIKRPCLQATLKEIKKSINNQNILVEDSEKDEPMNPCMDVYKAKIQYNGSLDKIKLEILVIGYLKNKELVGDTW